MTGIRDIVSLADNGLHWIIHANLHNKSGGNMEQWDPASSAPYFQSHIHVHDYTTAGFDKKLESK